MTIQEIRKEVLGTWNEGRCFIKWWRKENDFVDYELVDTFLANLKPDEEFAGFELLTMEQMWRELQRLVPERVALGQKHGEKVIRWQHTTGDGTVREDVFPYDASSLLTVFDGETRGDTLC